MNRDLEQILFTKKEIQERIATCQRTMIQAGLDGMILTMESNLRYFVDFHTHAPWSTYTRPNFLFIPSRGKPLLMVQNFLASEAKAIAKGCTVQGFESLRGPTAAELKEIMETLGLLSGRVGFELGYEQRLGFEINLFNQLKEICRETEFIDGSEIIWAQRIIKSPKEIECIRRACQATSYTHDHIFKKITEGMSEIEISRIAQQLMLEGGAEYPGFVMITSGKGNYSRISKTHTNRKLQKGDYMWLDLGARYNGYWSDFCRSGEVGALSDDRKNLQETISSVTARAAEVMGPGVAVAEVARACTIELERAGLEASFDCGRMGHGMGLMSTEPPSVTIHDDTVLQEGMIINLEPGIVTDRGVFNLEENYVITNAGYEILSGGSRNLHLIK